MLSLEAKNFAGGLDDDEEVLETTVSSWVLIEAWVEAEREVNPTVELGEATLSICPYLQSQSACQYRFWSEMSESAGADSSRTHGGSVRV